MQQGNRCDLQRRGGQTDWAIFLWLCSPFNIVQQYLRYLTHLNTDNAAFEMGMSHQSQPSPQFEMPKGTVPGRRSKEVSADGQRDLPGVCARQVSNPWLNRLNYIPQDELALQFPAESLRDRYFATLKSFDSIRFSSFVSFLPWLSALAPVIQKLPGKQILQATRK